MKDNLDKYFETTEDSDEEVEYKRVLVKPSKIKSFFGFTFSLVFFLICVFLILNSVLGFIITIIDFIILVYYGINLFSKKGIGVYKFVEVIPDEDNEEEEKDS